MAKRRSSRLADPERADLRHEEHGDQRCVGIRHRSSGKAARSWRDLNESERDARASALLGRPARLWLDPTFREFELFLLDYYSDRIIVPDEIAEHERAAFERAAAAYLFGRDSYCRLEVQSDPKRWGEVAGGELLRMIHELDPSLLRHRDNNRAINYGMRWLVRVLDRIERAAGRTPKPPGLMPDKTTPRPSAFSALCERYARLIDPALPDPIPGLGRTWYAAILKGKTNKKRPR